MCSLEKFGNIVFFPGSHRGLIFFHLSGHCRADRQLWGLKASDLPASWVVHWVMADFWETTVSRHKPRGYLLFLPKLSPLSFRGNLSLDDFMSPRHLCLKGLFIIVKCRGLGHRLQECCWCSGGRQKVVSEELPIGLYLGEESTLVACSQGWSRPTWMCSWPCSAEMWQLESFTLCPSGLHLFV